MAKLTTTVHVHDDDGRTTVLGPGDTVPDWAVEKITNPDVWDEPPTGEPDRKEDGGTSRNDGPPPMSGAGSGREAWAAYAAAHDVAVPDDAKRDDIVAAVQAAGVETEA
jgi:hypothetical protein